MEQDLALAQSATAISAAAREFVAFSEGEPALAAQAGVEVLALEARGILSGGAHHRLASTGAGPADLGALSRLEGIVALAGARLDALDAAIARDSQGSGIEQLAGFIGLASGAVGLYNALA